MIEILLPTALPNISFSGGAPSFAVMASWRELFRLSVEALPVARIFNASLSAGYLPRAKSYHSCAAE